MPRQRIHHSGHMEWSLTYGIVVARTVKVNCEMTSNTSPLMCCWGQKMAKTKSKQMETMVLNTSVKGRWHQKGAKQIKVMCKQIRWHDHWMNLATVWDWNVNHIWHYLMGTPSHDDKEHWHTVRTRQFWKSESWIHMDVNGLITHLTIHAGITQS